MSLVSLLFGFKGRINRVQFWAGMVGAGFAGMLLMFMLGVMFMPQGPVPKTAGGALQAISGLVFTVAPVWILLCWIGFALQTKRFHDRGRSGLWTMLPLLPSMMIMSTLVSIAAQAIHSVQMGVASGGEVFMTGAAGSIGIWVLLLNLINLFMFVDLGCMPGKPGPNKYGDPPGGGFTGGGYTGGAPVGGGTPIPGQSTPRPMQPVPGMGSTLTNAESAIERAIAARGKQQAAAPVAASPMAAPRPAMAAAQPSGGLRPATGGSFGRKAPR